MADNLNYKELALQLLLEANGAQERYKTVPSSTPSTITGHGPGGLFSTPGLSKALFSAMILPRQGVAAQLPIRPTVETNPIFGIITGVTASSGSNPEGVCDDPPTSGVMKLCNHSFVFGRYSRQSRVFDLDRAGKIVNRGEFQDFNVFGNPLTGNTGGGPGATAPLLPGLANINSAAINEVSKALWEFGVSWVRDFAKQVWTGNPTNNTAGGGYKEFYGLDTLINTGYRDAETGSLCAAADSLIYSFGSVDVKTNSATIVRAITSILHRLKYLSAHANLDPVQWKLAMTMSMFYELTEIWPIAYATYRAQALVPTGSTNFVDSMEMERMRDDMRGDLYNYNGQYLLIDGVKIPVIIDDTIAETQTAGSSFTSTIYFLPFTVLGGEPVLYLEYFNYDIPGGALDMARVFAPADSFYTTDAGRFLWHKKPPTNFCVQVLAKTEPRMLLLTPYLAARLTDVKYTPFAHERSWDPTNTSYWVDGGRTTGPNPNPSYLVVPG